MKTKHAQEIYTKIYKKTALIDESENANITTQHKHIKSLGKDMKTQMSYK